MFAKDFEPALKILFILSEYLPDSGGGIISYYKDILPRLVAMGHEIHVLVAEADHMDRPDCDIDGVHVSYLKSDFFKKAAPGFDRYRAGYPTLWALLPIAWAAYEQAEHGKGFDLIETTDFALLFAPWVGGDTPPVNISLHGSCGQLDWYGDPANLGLDANLVRLIERAAFSSACAVQANSETNSRFWQTMTNRDIPVLLPSFRISNLPTAGSKESQAGIVVGRLQNLKGPRVLCEALKTLSDVRVHWVGLDMIRSETKLPMSKTLETEFPNVFGSRLVHQNPISHDQVLSKIAGASFLCIPSIWDVFNLTAPEAMSLGTPVICSRTAGASMLIRYGENGFLFDPANPAELTGCIRRVLSLTDSERAAIVEKARETVIQKLDPDHLCVERLEYYKSLASAPQRLSDDEWLRTIIAPHHDASDRTEILRAFTVKELVVASSRQVVDGVKRRLRPSKEAQAKAGQIR